ncbi:MAG: LD-carboxypeptidase [Bacteroidetes bacterium]|jgi:muramoyltetrapeptide carboxypeptidase|nr:LD-carboxypeptidase [Bacteroidota bacterium]
MSTKKIQPPFLRSGDEVAIISPSFAVEGEKIESATRLLEGWGLRVHAGTNVLKTYGPFAGTDRQRLTDFQRAVDNGRIKAIFCSRGGYGMLRIIDKIDFSSLKRYPKWFAGFSDITALHLWLSERCNIMSVHGEMPLNFSGHARDGIALTSLHDALFGNSLQTEWKGKTVRRRNVRGEVTGGNLSLVTSLLGTPAEPDTRGKILFIEDTGEYLYRLDRMLMSLRLAGKLESLAALIAGGFRDIEETRKPWGKSPEDLIKEVTAGYEYPVIFNFPAGHIDNNCSFYIGREALIEFKGRNVVMVYP